MSLTGQIQNELPWTYIKICLWRIGEKGYIRLLVVGCRQHLLLCQRGKSVLVRTVNGNLDIHHIAMDLQGSLLTCTRQACLYIDPHLCAGHLMLAIDKSLQGMGQKIADHSL